MDPSYFKTKLEEELQTLESELGTLGRLNPDTPGDWEATPGDFETNPAEEEERAEKFEELENNQAVLNPLELRLRDVKRALAKLEAGNYGICEISGEPIEEERLEANPAARTCIEHLDQEKNLPL
jgi:RNA polymerase-binding transcription factor DksA